MIKAGFLSPLRGRRISTETSLTHVKTHKGDFEVGQLAHAVNTKERNDFIVQKFLEHAEDRKGIAFCVNVQHCRDLAESFISQGIKTRAVWGTQKPEERKQVLQDLKSGALQMVTSCGVLTEGFDEPSITVIVMARPTKSRGLYIQMCGRGTRKAPNKNDCLVLDFQDHYYDIDKIMSLRATIPEAVEEVPAKIETLVVDENYSYNAQSEIVEISDEEFDLFAVTKLTWSDIGDGEFSMADDDMNEIVIRPVADGYVADLFVKGVLEPFVVTPLPLDYCIGLCEDFARAHMNLNFAESNGSWIMKSKQEKPTSGQRDMLKKNGVKMTTKMSRADASIEIRRIVAIKAKERRMRGIEPITERQKMFLDHAGINTDNLDKMQAMSMISKIKKEQYARN